MSGYCFLASNPPALQAAKGFLRKNRDHESGRFTDLPEEMNGGSHAQAKSSSNIPWSGNKLICGGDSSWCCSSFISLIRSYYRWSISGPWKCCVGWQGFDPKKKQTLWHWQTFFNVYRVEVLDWCPQIHRNTFSKRSSLSIHALMFDGTNPCWFMRHGGKLGF